MTTAQIEATWPRSIQQMLDKHSIRLAAWKDVCQKLNDTTAEAGSPEMNVLAAERAKAERYLVSSQRSLETKGWTFTAPDAEPTPPEPKPEAEEKPAKPKKSKASKTNGAKWVGVKIRAMTDAEVPKAKNGAVFDVPAIVKAVKKAGDEGITLTDLRAAMKSDALSGGLVALLVKKGFVEVVK